MAVAFDTETYPIEPGLLAPPLVCLTIAWDTPERPDCVPPPSPGILLEDGAALLTAEAVSPVVVRALLRESTVIAANAPFDLLGLAAHAADPPPGAVWAAEDVLPDVVEALRAGRVSDVQVRERLVLNARGTLSRFRVSLADLVYRYLGEEPGRAVFATKGPDTLRTRYNELDGVPLSAWPDAATAYALDDARLTLRVHRAQTDQTPPTVGGYPLVAGDRIVTEARETRAAFALHLQAAWALRTDAHAVEALIAEWTATAEAGRAAGLAGGWVRGPDTKPASKAGTLDKKVLQRIVSDAFGGHPPLTKACGIGGCSKARKHDGPHGEGRAGQVCIDTDTLIAAAEREGSPPTLRRYADSLQAGRYLTVWGPALRRGVDRPLTYKVTHLLETGRVSIAEPPLQQPPRKGGVRPCFVARPGYVLVSVDFDTAELCGLGQIHLWMGLGSTLADAINAGKDVHCMMAEALAEAEGREGWTYDRLVALKKSDPVAKHLRQLSKVANFGFPGGLGPDAFVAYAAGQDPPVVVAPVQARILREAWKATWPEMAGYFRRINNLLGDAGAFVAQHPISGRLRGAVGYTDGCNGFFQGLVADGAKEACWDLCAAAYADPPSPFYGSRPALMLHDEVIAEVPEENLTAAADEMARIMRAALQRHIPDVRIKAEPAAMRRWYKDAETVRDASGRLVVWVPTPPAVREGTPATEATP